MPVVDRELKKATDARYWARLSPEKRAARAARRRAQKAIARELREQQARPARKQRQSLATLRKAQQRRVRVDDVCAQALDVLARDPLMAAFAPLREVPEVLP